MTLELRGSRRVRNNLRRVVADAPEIADGVLEEHTVFLRKTLKATKYARKRPGQTYVRTGLLANSWFRRRVKPGVWSVGNSAPGREYVIDENKQAWMHQDRWWTMQEIERNNRRRLTKNLSDAFTEVLTDGG